jgi:hypothetical protein
MGFLAMINGQPKTVGGGLDLDTRACLLALRIVAVSLVISLIWKFRAFGLAIDIYRELPLMDDFFPFVLQSTNVMIAAYFASLLSVSYLMIGTRTTRLTLACLTGLFSLGVLCLHQQSYNDVTFLTCWWTTMWCLWFVRRLGDPAQPMMERATFLAHAILSVIFLGGSVGKLTAGYWSGEVFYAIYFEGRNYWLFNLMRSLFSEDYLAIISCWYSRVVIVMEAICACIWLMPARLASFFAIFVLCNIALMSNTLLFSVLTCLIGLALAGLHQPLLDSSREETASRDDSLNSL